MDGPRSTPLTGQISLFSTDRLTKEVSWWKFGRKTRRKNSIFGVSVASSLFSLLLLATSTSCRFLQRKILRNSLRNAGFIPAYMKGLIVFDKYKRNIQKSSTFRGITATRRKRRRITMIQKGIQQIMKAKTTANRDLLSLIS